VQAAARRRGWPQRSIMYHTPVYTPIARSLGALPSNASVPVPEVLGMCEDLGESGYYGVEFFHIAGVLQLLAFGFIIYDVSAERPALGWGGMPWNDDTCTSTAAGSRHVHTLNTAAAAER